MTRQWMRMVDSAQRRVVLERPRTLTHGSLDRLTVEIQGLLVEAADRFDQYFFSDMAEYGTKFLGVKPLSPWQRIMRHPAKIGKIELNGSTSMIVSFWTNPVLDLTFDLDDEDQVNLWKECEVMALSAGFHFEIPGEIRDLPLRDW